MVGRKSRENGGQAKRVFHKEGNNHKGYRLLGVGAGWLRNNSGSG